MRHLILAIIFLTITSSVEAKVIVHIKSAAAKSLREPVDHTEPKQTNRPTDSSRPTTHPISFMTDLLGSPLLNSDEWKVIVKYPHRHLIAAIYWNESNFGKYDVCRAQGKFNGFGYNEWTGHHPTCYDSFEEVVKQVNDWVDDKVQKGWSFNRINCFYVRGLNQENCDTAYKLTSIKL